jgi:hypothetical protein
VKALNPGNGMEFPSLMQDQEGQSRVFQPPSRRKGGVPLYRSAEGQRAFYAGIVWEGAK